MPRLSDLLPEVTEPGGPADDLDAWLDAEDVPDGTRFLAMAAPPPAARSRPGQERLYPGGADPLAALHLQLTEPATEQRRRRTRRGVDIRYQPGPEDVIGYLRDRQITLTYDPAAGALNAGTAEAAPTITLTAS